MAPGLGIVLVVGGTQLAVAGRRQFIRAGLAARWAVGRRAVAPIIEAREGVVRLDGRAHAAEPPLTAPLSQATCLFFDFVLDDLSSRGRQLAHRWRGSSFYVDDGTGRALVTFEETSPLAPTVLRPRTVIGAVARPLTVTNGLFSRDDPRIRALLSNEGITHPGLVIPHRLRAREGRITDGDTISIVGCARLESDVAGDRGGYREPARRYAIGPGPESPLFIVKRTP